jgi:opacity protein-like surface antigen
MQKKSILVFLVAAIMLVLNPTGLWAQLDVAVSGYGAFNQSSSGNGVAQTPANQAGALIEVRRIVHAWLGYEGMYSFNRANQSYATSNSVVCGVCAATVSDTVVPANAHQIGGAWVASLKVANFRPFALAGAGVLLNEPANGQATTTTLITLCGTSPTCTVGARTTSTAATGSSTKAVFIYGAGVDWTLFPHLGLRFQYRGNLYKAPELVSAFSSTNRFVQTAEPMIGAFFKF